MKETGAPINWYPGHMAKAKRLITDQMKRVDLVIELCDARLPYSSRNPELGLFAPEKNRILFANKADLASPAVTSQWIKYFRSSGIKAFELNSLKTREKDLISIINKETDDIVEKAKERGIKKTVRAMVIGVPNVGKSTFINRIRRTSITKTGDKPGVTRSNQWVKITPYLELLDTPGLLWPRLDDQNAARRLCYIGSVSDEVVNLDELTIHLLSDLCRISPQMIVERFHITDISCEGVELLNQVCAGRGWLLKGGQYDYERCCKTVLDEFRAGKLGRISLEMPPEQ